MRSNRLIWHFGNSALPRRDYDDDVPSTLAKLKVPPSESDSGSGRNVGVVHRSKERSDNWAEPWSSGETDLGDISEALSGQLRLQEIAADTSGHFWSIGGSVHAIRARFPENVG